MVKQRSFISILLVLLVCVALFSGCADGFKSPFKPAPHDVEGGLTREDYKKGLIDRIKKPLPEPVQSSLPMPTMLDFMAEMPEPVLNEDRLVSIAVTEDIPLKDVLIELGRRAEVDMEIDSNIEGGIIFRASNRPFSKVVERIAKLAGLKYSMEDDILRIERDLPVIKHYRMNLLNQVRTSSSTVNISTNLVNGGGGGGEGGTGGGGFSSGSQSELSASTEQGDIWQDIQTSVANIIAQFNREQQFIAQPVASDGASDGAADASSAASSGTDAALPPGILSVNRPAGLLTVLATERQHQHIKQYLDYVQVSNSSQVLIEAKILEVSLNDEFRSGIDWNFLNSNVTGLTATSQFNDAGFDAGSPQTFSVGVLPAELFGIGNTSLDASIELVQAFGTSRTLSSPRLHAMNNQYAVLTFAENFVYFRLNVEEETEDSGVGSGSTSLTVSSEIQTVPVGVLLAIQPSIDLERGEVIMSVRPTLSRVTGSVSDPAVSLIAAQNNVDITSNIPVVEIRELDSVLRLKSGQVMVIGGLMEERNDNNDRGIPGLSDVPFIGNAFKSRQRVNDVVETIIFIKATIVPGQGVTVEDKALYNTFANTKRKI